MMTGKTRDQFGEEDILNNRAIYAWKNLIVVWLTVISELVILIMCILT